MKLDKFTHIILLDGRKVQLLSDINTKDSDAVCQCATDSHTENENCFNVSAREIDTYATRKHRRNMARHSRIRKQTESIIADIVRLYERAEKYSLTHREILDALYGDKGIKSKERTKGLSMYELGQIEGVKQLLHNQAQRKLVWTHIDPRDGIRKVSEGNTFDGVHDKIDTKTSCHCWKMPDGALIPYDLKQ